MHTYYVGEQSVLVHNDCSKAADAADDAVDDVADDLVNVASDSRTEHLLYGDETGGGHLWPGSENKTPFPQDWSADDIMHQVSDIATDPSLEWIPNKIVGGSQRYEVIGERSGELIKVITDGKDIITAFPIN